MNDERDARKVDEPTGPPPDEGLAYDPSMTEGDEANIPPQSDADPEATDEQGDRSDEPLPGSELIPPR
jgi:hypothetical protein